MGGKKCDDVHISLSAQSLWIRQKGERTRYRGQSERQRTSFLLSQVSLYLSFSLSSTLARAPVCFLRRQQILLFLFLFLFPLALSERFVRMHAVSPPDVREVYRVSTPTSLSVVLVHARIHRSTEGTTLEIHTTVLHSSVAPMIHHTRTSRKGTYQPPPCLSLYLLTIVFDPPLFVRIGRRTDRSHVTVRVPSCRAGKVRAEASTTRAPVDGLIDDNGATLVTRRDKDYTLPISTSHQCGLFLPPQETASVFSSITRPPPYESPRSMAVYARLSLCTTPRHSVSLSLSLSLSASAWISACECARAYVHQHDDDDYYKTDRTSERASERKSGQNEARSLHSKNGNTEP